MNGKLVTEGNVGEMIEIQEPEVCPFSIEERFQVMRYLTLKKCLCLHFCLFCFVLLGNLSF